MTGDLITSAGAGSAASAWINNTLFDYSYFMGPDAESTIGSIDKITVLYKNDFGSHDAMRNQEIVFERDNYRVSGLLIQAAANDDDDGKVLTYDAVKNIYAWKEVPVNNGNYVSAFAAQKITLASAAALPSPTAMATGVYYIV